MNLYFTDSLGNKKVIAYDIADPQSALEKIVAHQASRFIYKSGICKIETTAATPFVFTSADGKTSGYTLEN